MEEPESGRRRLRQRADSVAAALVVLGRSPERVDDPVADLAFQHATLLAAAVAPYRETAADPQLVYGGPAVLARGVQNVHEYPEHRHLPVHEHLITHLGLAAEYVRALFGAEGDGRPQHELLIATREFLTAMITAAGQTAYHLRSAHLGPTGRPSDTGLETISYAVNGDILASLADAAEQAATRMRRELDRLTEPGARPRPGDQGPPGPSGQAPSGS
ncbi:hypothetical protein [Streptantibioticus ferralitis]|uniref:Uncharacterized protein n=1 Tax=Streptantibioticus ferralitis TaxID=236510 RepID=A0ABT5Z318_9ACTN|nr:hypothetical protein [Streptantibioticus ferralitis]MDF2257971.1 hypothetical protein [Streptantibioticus ferralitis]